MFNENEEGGRRLFSMYCRLHAIEGFYEEKQKAEQILESHANGRVCICILPVLEDGEHYYAQCNFRRAAEDNYEFKFLNTLKLLCEQRVLPTLDRDHSVDAYLFSAKEGLDEFAAQAVHRSIVDKFELVE